VDLAEMPASARSAASDLAGYIAASLEERRGRPRDDLLSLFVAAEEAGQLAHGESRGLTFIFVLAGREFAWPVTEEDHGLIRRILARSDAYHGRVASREQVQVQTSFPHNQNWLDLFAGWWEEGFRMFIERASPGDVLTFMPELGPPEWYAMTGAAGEELSDRWAEALQLRDLVQGLWHKAFEPTAVAAG
jgi:hypothetical protein